MVQEETPNLQSVDVFQGYLCSSMWKEDFFFSINGDYPMDIQLEGEKKEP